MKRIINYYLAPILAIIRYLLFLLFVAPFEVEAQAPPYLRTFNVVRTVNVSDSSQLSAALSGAVSGDQIVMADGTYSGTYILSIASVMIKCDGHCIINGSLKLAATNTWLWHVEVTGNAGNLVSMEAADTVVVNSVIHGQGALGVVGILAGAYANQIIYGTTIFNCQHDLYAQNTAPATKYVVANAFVDIVPSNNSRTIHAYAESANKMENMQFIRNIVVNGQALLGGQVNATPPIGNIFQEMIFYKADLVLGYKRPNDTNVTDSLFLRSRLDNQWFWGEGELIYAPGTIFVTGNTFFNPGNQQVALTTSAYTPNRVQCSPKLRAADVFDQNSYLGGFNNALCANSVNDVTLQPLSLWQSKTESAGNRFDANSSSSTAAPTDGFRFVPNEYDSEIGMLAVWNFSGSQSVSVTLPQAATLYGIKDRFGSPIANVPAGTFQLAQSTEFEAYHVKFVTEAPPPACDLQAVEAKRLEALTILNDPTLKHGQKIKQTRIKLNEQGILLAPCLEP